MPTACRPSIGGLEARRLLSAAAAVDTFYGQQVGVEGTVTAMTLADINGDAIPDLVTVGHTGSQPDVTTRWGDGTGHFGPRHLVQVGRGIVSAVTADFNGDGRPDLLTGGSSEVAVHLNEGGALGESDRYSAGADGVVAVAPGDMDGDGDVDIVSLNSTQKHVAIFRNHGDGTFPTPPITYSTTNAYSQLVVADLDGDGDQDIAAAGGFQARILMNGGNLSFATQRVYTLPDAISDLDAADVDGDGDTDLLAANYSYGAFTVFRNAGDATFVTTRVASTQTLPDDLAAADFDGDGDVDVAVTRLGNVQVMANAGDGTSFTPCAVSPIGGTANHFLTADVNNDGSADLVASHSTFSTERDTVTTLVNAGEADFGSPRGLIGRGGTAVAAGDFDGDGDTDLATVNGSGAGAANVNVLRNAGNRTFEATTVSAGTGVNDVIAVDVDGDHDLDLVTAHDTGQKLAVLKNDGSGTFAAPVNYLFSRKVNRVIAADLNGDGRPDLAAICETTTTAVYSVAVLLNTGNAGAFAPAAHYPGSVFATDLAALDVDEDGDLDLVSATAQPHLRIYANDGAGGFPTYTTFAMFTAVYPYALQVADLNADGRPELVSANGGTDGVSVLTVLPDGGGFAPPVTYDAGLRGENLVVTDVDNDGDGDVVMSNTDADSVSVLANNGDGTLAAERRYVTGAAPQGLAAADFNGDGYQDVVTVHSTTNDASFLMNRAGVPLNLPSWVSSTVNGVSWDPGTQTLTVGGPATIDAVPAVRPTVVADGAAAVLTLDPGDPAAVHLAGLRLSNGAVARLAASGAAPASSAGRHTLVINGPGALSIDAASVLDLADNALLVRGASLAGVQSAIASGFNGGNWRGAGITSSAAGADPTGATALGYATNAALGLAQFNGVGGLDAGDLLVRYTYFGDTNLDGLVNTDDIINILAGGKLDQELPGTWFEGDVNYDGRVDTDDIVNLLATGRLDQQ